MKIVISIFCLPYEIDELERMIIQLKRGTRYLSDKNEWILDVSLGLSDYLVDWDKSQLSKLYFMDKLHYLESICDWCKTSFTYNENIMGCVSQRRDTLKVFNDADYFIWLDTDLVFDERTLSYIEHSIGATLEVYPLSIMTPEIVRVWDETWDCLVNDKFLDKSLDYQKTNDPFLDCGVKGDVGLTQVHNNIPGQPQFKFAGGWFTCISGKLLRKIGIPDMLGHYGLEDTFIMNAADYFSKNNGDMIVQFKITNLVVCENYKYRDNQYLTNQLRMINRKDEFLKVAHTNYQPEMMKLLNG